MLLANQLKITKQANSTVLYDAGLIATPILELFDSDYHANSENQQNNSTLMVPAASSKSGIGRAHVVYFDHENIKMVLKHYYRGGLIASIVKDKYIGLNIENTRAFKEFRLLKKMQQLGLPVPEAIAAHVEKHLFFFRADLITREIENAQTLADLLVKQAVDSGVWKKIGACIKLFHQHNVYHSDLNARNIMLSSGGSGSSGSSGSSGTRMCRSRTKGWTGGLSEAGSVYLIDFDNSCFRIDSASWKLANLARLKRSLLKFKKNAEGFNFTERDWSALLDGYK